MFTDCFTKAPEERRTDGRGASGVVELFYEPLKEEELCLFLQQSAAGESVGSGRPEEMVSCVEKRREDGG